MGEEAAMDDYDGLDLGLDDERVMEWETGLPGSDELTPLSQPLVPPGLAAAFRITPEPGRTLLDVHRASAATVSRLRRLSSSSGGGGGSSFPPYADHQQAAAAAPADPTSNSKRPRLVWTPQLHKRFVDAVAHLGIKNAVPKTIMQLMSVDGLTRENVASHLQKYRLYLKRMQGQGGGGGGGGGAGGSHSSGSGTDAATEHLFATGPVPFPPPPGHGRAPPVGAADPYPPFAAMGGAHHHHHHSHAAPPQIGHFHHHPAARPLGHGHGQYAAAVPGFDHGFLSRAGPPVGPPGMGMHHHHHHHRMPGGAMAGIMAPAPFADDMDLGSRGGAASGGRRELTLFPTSGDH